MNGLRLCHSDRIKYLGIYIDEILSGNEHCEELVKKLSRANGIIAKARHYVPLKHVTSTLQHSRLTITKVLKFGV